MLDAYLERKTGWEEGCRAGTPPAQGCHEALSLLSLRLTVSRGWRESGHWQAIDPAASRRRWGLTPVFHYFRLSGTKDQEFQVRLV